MKKTLPLLIALSTTAIALTTARPSAPVLTVKRVETATVAGKTVERLTPAKEAIPGAVYQVEIATAVPESRGGSKPQNASVTFPIPMQATFVAGSANGGREGVTVLYTLKTPAKPSDFSTKPTKTVTVKENGLSVTRTVPAPANEYRAVKFVYGSMSGDFKSSLRYRVN